jgi:hypothetical protein
MHRIAFSFVFDMFATLRDAGAFVHESILPEFAELRDLGTVRRSLR